MTPRIAAVATLLLAGCSAHVSISARHDPLYDARPHTSTITATADVKGERGIASIQIDVTTGDITACTDSLGLPSVIPCRANATVQSWTCTYAGRKKPTLQDCSAPIALGDRQLVTYQATVTSGSGKTAVADPITYSAGAPLTAFTYAFEGNTVSFPWELARPVWWHSCGPPSCPDHIDIGLFPDPDYNANYAAFTQDLNMILLNAHFNFTNGFAQYYSSYQKVFDLWAGPDGADGFDTPKCDTSFPPPAAAIAAITDGDVVLHSAFFRDCGSFLGWGTVFTGNMTATGALNFPALVYMHESGHFLHKLSDEYVNCKTGAPYKSESTPKNVFDSEDDCKTTAASEALDSSKCKEIKGPEVGSNPPKTCSTAHWRYDDGSLEIMVRTDSATAAFRNLSNRAVGNHVDACMNGACY